MNEKPIIQTKGISRTYFTEENVGTTVLKPTDLNINEGEFTAIMGPSGSGKSTLLHILGLLDRPTKGQYTFNNHDIINASDTELAHIRNETIGFVFQAFHLLARTSVLENVMLPLQYSKIPKPKHLSLAQKAIEQVGLGHRSEHTPAQLSGGEKQRTAIARALVTQPSILMADEPTGNLDSKSGQQIMDIIENLNYEGMTVIVITHETAIANYAERIISITDGKIESDLAHNSAEKFVTK